MKKFIGNASLNKIDGSGFFPYYFMNSWVNITHCYHETGLVINFLYYHLFKKVRVTFNLMGNTGLTYIHIYI